MDNLRGNEAVKDYYHILHNNTRRLLNLVNELLDFRTLQHGKMRLQVLPTDLNRLVGSVSADFDELARRRRIRFVRTADPAMPHTVYADRQVVEKIIMNLLNNSFKHTPEGGEIRIETYGDSARFSRRHEAEFTVGSAGLRRVAIVVRDTGVGISSASIGTVFERYYSVKSENLSSHLGTGIGLALAKSLVELHKGRITIYSTRGHGTDMLVVLPHEATVYTPDQFAAEPAADQTVAADVAALAGSRLVEDIRRGEAHDVLLRERRRILLAEDNDDLRRLIVDFLAPWYDVEQAPNGWVASRYLEDNEVNLVVSDIMMSVKDGITLCRELKSNVDTCHIPFIMLTARTGAEFRLEGAESGADYYFEKPVDLNLLLVTIRNLFDRQDKLREHYAHNYYVDSAELAANEKDNAFLKKLMDIIDANLAQPVIDVHLIASEMSMSRTKLYSKLKSLTGRSIVEFTLNYRLRKAAKLMIEQDLSMKEVMERIGIRSQSYFTNTFKKEFGQTPAAFARQHNRSKKR
ncbi:MAG: ATP-binding protein [Alistipes sp.]|nr:ATP-binding protein [Alistipes sp.]